MHFKFKEAMNRRRCQIKGILLYNSSIEGNIKVENIDTTAWVVTVLIIPAAQRLGVDFSKYTHEGLGCCCIQLFRERLSEKVQATVPKGIVGGFEFTVVQRNLRE